jgi:ANTAR domain
VNEKSEVQAIESLGGGTVHEAAAAIGRLLAVTEASYERRAQLEEALQSRVAIEQAKGVLAERYRLDVDEAFQIIRRAARSHRMKLHELVGKIRPGVPTPNEVSVVLEQPRRSGEDV